jgi:hypothetical protein
MGKGAWPEDSPSQPHDFEDVQQSLLAFHDKRLQSNSLEPLGVKMEEMASIGKRAFPKTGWPDHVQPVPDILESFAKLYKSQNELEQSLRLYLKLCFIISPSIIISSRPEWVHLLFELQGLLGLIVNESKARSPSVATLLKANLPLRKIYEACLNQAAAAAAGTYGADSAFAIAAKHFWTSELEGRQRRKPVNNYNFIARFQKEFSALFQWAGLG